MKMIRVIKANYQFIEYQDKNGSCYIPLQKGRIEVHTASRGAWTVEYTTGELADLGKGFKVFDNLEDAKEYALKLAKKYDFKVYDKLINSKNVKANEKWAVYLRGEKISPSFDSRNDAKEWAEENFEIDNDDISIQKDYDN